jgi:hypothetical protein
MLKTAMRMSGIGVAVCGLALAFAPAAGASTVNSSARPVIQTASAPSATGVYNPCNGSVVETTGHIQLMTVTSGQNTVAGFLDNESGDGYTMIEAGGGTFHALASSYAVPSEGVWLDRSNPQDSFRWTFTQRSP